MTEIFLQSTDHPQVLRIACDDDTKYWIFDDSCEPVGLTCAPKQDWQQISASDYRQMIEARPVRRSDDPLLPFMNLKVLERAQKVLEWTQKL